LVAYFLLRQFAFSCSGGLCDWYIPFSLLLPLAALGLVAIIAINALPLAPTGWRPILAVAGLISFFGPFVALAIWRDQPDVLVPVATVLLLILPLVALLFTLTAGRR
jgi:hypothetical protein